MNGSVDATNSVRAGRRPSAEPLAGQIIPMPAETIFGDGGIILDQPDATADGTVQCVVVVDLPRNKRSKLMVESLIAELSHQAHGQVFTLAENERDARSRLREAFGPAAEAPGSLPALTQRERDVLSCLGRGEPAKRIAQQLGISVHTCRGHLKFLYKKLRVHSQVEAVIKAHALGLLDP